MLAETVHEHVCGSVRFGAFDRPATVRAGDDPPLKIPRTAVGELHSCALDGDLTCRRRPAQDPVSGDVRPDHHVVRWEPQRPLTPRGPAAEPLDGHRGIDQLPKALVFDLDCCPWMLHCTASQQGVSYGTTYRMQNARPVCRPCP